MTPPEMLPWNGLQVNIVADTPRMQLSEDCPVTDDFRKQTNDWMLSFFGPRNTVPDGVVYQNTSTGQLFCNPRTADFIRRAIAMEKTMAALGAKQSDTGNNFIELPKNLPKPKADKPRQRSKHFKHIPRR